MSFESWSKREKRRLKHRKSGSAVRKIYDREKTQSDEFEDALNEHRQPRCIYCEHPLDGVSETQGIFLSWAWDREQKRYVKSETDDGWSDKPMCDHCQTKDWDFTNNGWIKY